MATTSLSRSVARTSKLFQSPIQSCRHTSQRPQCLYPPKTTAPVRTSRLLSTTASTKQETAHITPTDLPTMPYHNPFKAKKQWPPDFSKLSSTYQLRLERRYRRRMKLKYARPGWTKFTILLQWSMASFVLVYGVLFMDWSGVKGDEEPFQGIRNWFHETTAALWTRPDPSRYRSTSTQTEK